MNKKLLLISAISSAAIFLAIPNARAATLNVSLDKDTFNIGDQFVANVKLDTENVGINAAQATIQYRSDLVEVLSFDKTNSIFNFWLEEPSFSNQNGTLSFIGGATTGFSGKTLQLLKITFRVKGAGTGSLVFTDAAVTASDGSGTNVLSNAAGANITSLVRGAVAPSGSSPAAPRQITRPAAEATGLPSKPKLEVPLYPDPTAWYNLYSKFSASWDLPADVTAVGTSINKEPNFNVTKPEGLFTNEIYPALDDGVWYLHVRFRNDIGWGPTSHWRVAIDTAPPLGFEINIAEGNSTDNPAPSLSFKSGDALSGIDHYAIRVGDSDPIIADKSPQTLPVQTPGNRQIKIAAFDKAGNSTENSVSLEIIPILSPSIASAPGTVVFGNSFSIDGSSSENTRVEVSLKNLKNQTVAFKEVNIDDKGNWRAEFTDPVVTGKYYAEVKSVDKRGAQSLAVKSGIISIKAKPLLIVAGLELSAGWVAAIVVVIVLLAFAFNWYSIKLAKEQQRRKIIISQRDVLGAFSVIKKDLEKILDDFRDRTLDERETNEVEQILKRTSQKLENVPRYIAGGIEEIAEGKKEGKLFNYLAGLRDKIEDLSAKINPFKKMKSSENRGLKLFGWLRYTGAKKKVVKRTRKIKNKII